MIDRPRLQVGLARRFDVRLVTIIAPAGSGKSTLIELATADNELDPQGRDIVVTLRPRDAERPQFIDRLADSLGITTDAAADERNALNAIHDTIWAIAPTDVALWIDDAHVLDDDAVAALRTLIGELPANAHIVVSSRRQPALSVARLQARGEVIEFDSDSLQLDDDELERLAARLDTDVSALNSPPRHAATVALIAATGGTTAGVAFLQEEIISGLDADRADSLRQLVAVESFDAGLACELAERTDLDLDALLAGLPLVNRHEGSVVFHDLLRDALRSDLTAGELRKIRMKTGEILAERGDDIGAIDVFLAAGDTSAARAVARRFVMRPTLSQTATATRSITRRLASTGDELLLAALEATQVHTADLGVGEAVAWRRLRDLARNVDPELEALALHRLAQHLFFDFDPWDGLPDEAVDAYERLVELADTTELARGAAAHIASQSAQSRADTAAALSTLDDYRHFPGDDGVMMRQQRLVDLGFVERVGQELTPDQLAELPTGSEMFVAFAMWLRGEGPPEFAEAMVRSMIETIEARGQHVPLTSTIGTAVPIALACGDVRTASARVARLREVVRVGHQPRSLHLFLAIAEALVAAVDIDDEAGIERLRSFGRWTAIRSWPLRVHLLALPFCYLAFPESRTALDAMQTGPAITRAIDAGRALVALRERDDPQPSVDLAWSEPTQLRNLVLPHHLAELVCAADVSGHPTARELIAQLPDPERLLRRVAEQGAPSAAANAVALLGDLPRQEPPTLRLRVLGPSSLAIGDGADRADDTVISLGTRGRVTELLALLALRTSMTRDDVIDAIWGGYDTDDKAGASLRAAISQANKLLEPDRDRATPPVYLRTDGNMLSLHHVSTDVDEFERHHDLARAADLAGTPRAALRHYLDAAEQYRGDFLVDNDASWAVLDRLRLRSLAAGTACRISELVAANGEAESAATWARQALAHEPLSDRAAVAFLRALLATDDRRSAALAAAELLGDRKRAGVTPSRELTRLTERLPELG